MAIATITLLGKATIRDDLKGRPVSRSGHYEWEVPILAYKDFGRLIREIDDAIGLGRTSNNETFFEIIVSVREEELTDDHWMISEIGEIVNTLTENAGKASR